MQHNKKMRIRWVFFEHLIPKTHCGANNKFKFNEFNYIFDKTVKSKSLLNNNPIFYNISIVLSTYLS